MVGRASAVLDARARWAAFAALAAADVAYYLWHGHLPRLSLWQDVGVIAFPLLPAVFGLVWLALPVRHAVALLGASLQCGLLAYLAREAHYGILFNYAKLAGIVLLAFWFLQWFEELSWIVLIACMIPFVDAFSVFAPVGPTHRIVEHHISVYTNLAIAFPVPGNDGAVQLGVPDVLFFSLFLAAADRWRLRVGWTWLAMVAGLAATFALTVAFPRFSGLPALPLLSVGFFAANGDVLWRLWRRRA